MAKSKTISNEALNFAEAMRLARVEKGWIADKLADKISIEGSSVRKWESFSQPVPWTRVSKIATILDLPQTVVDQYLASKNKNGRFTKGSFATFLQAGVSKEWLLSQIYEVMDEHPPDVIPEGVEGSNDMGKDEKWNSVIINYPSALYAVVDNQKNKMAGYWHVMSVKDKIFKNGIEGKNINRDFELSNVRGFDIPGRHNLYFVDLFRRWAYTAGEVNKQLFDGFVDFLTLNAKNGHFVKNIFAHASNPVAESMCNDAGFSSDWVAHKEHRRKENPGSEIFIPTKIYQLALHENCDNRIFNANNELQELYKNHFGY